MHKETELKTQQIKTRTVLVVQLYERPDFQSEWCLLFVVVDSIFLVSLLVLFLSSVMCCTLMSCSFCACLHTLRFTPCQLGGSCSADYPADCSVGVLFVALVVIFTSLVSLVTLLVTLLIPLLSAILVRASWPAISHTLEFVFGSWMFFVHRTHDPFLLENDS